MNKALKVLISIVLFLLFAFCTIAIVGAFNLDPGETINKGRLAAVIVGEVVAIGGMIALWRGRSAAA